MVEVKVSKSTERKWLKNVHITSNTVVFAQDGWTDRPWLKKPKNTTHYTIHNYVTQRDQNILDYSRFQLRFKECALHTVRCTWQSKTYNKLYWPQHQSLGRLSSRWRQCWQRLTWPPQPQHSLECSLQANVQSATTEVKTFLMTTTVPLLWQLPEMQVCLLVA